MFHTYGELVSCQAPSSLPHPLPFLNPLPPAPPRRKRVNKYFTLDICPPWLACILFLTIPWRSTHPRARWYIYIYFSPSRLFFVFIFMFFRVAPRRSAGEVARRSLLRGLSELQASSHQPWRRSQWGFPWGRGGIGSSYRRSGSHVRRRQRGGGGREGGIFTCSTGVAVVLKIVCPLFFVEFVKRGKQFRQ